MSIIISNYIFTHADYIYAILCILSIIYLCHRRALPSSHHPRLGPGDDPGAFSHGLLAPEMASRRLERENDAQA